MSSSLKAAVHARLTRRFSSGTCMDCTPVKWTKYFEHQEKVKVRDNVFHVYLRGFSAPLLLMIHGGGYSALTWSLLVEDIIDKVECSVMAVDLRAHGNTKTGDEEDLSLEVLAQDVADIVYAFYEFKDGVPPIVLIGHSLGGAIAVAVSKLISEVVGLCVIDVVEGTALESLSSMQSILRSRPLHFKSIDQAIQWCYQSGQTHNLEAARVSMPGQIKNVLTGELAANESTISSSSGSATVGNRPSAKPIHLKSEDSIEEENEDDNESFKTASDQSPSSNLRSSESFFKVPNAESNYTWRIDLSKTERYWVGWFKGMSEKFLSVSVSKLLLLANIHGLDTALTVGQMQGKFQMHVLPKSGHAIHEDQPQQVAEVIARFLVKQKLAVAMGGSDSSNLSLSTSVFGIAH